MSRMAGIWVSLITLIQLSLSFGLSPLSLAQEWHVRKPQGVIKVVALMDQPPSAAVNYTETLVALDEESNVVP